MSINRWVDKEVMVHNFNGILLSYKKEHIWASSTEVAEPKAYTKWSKPERENKYCLKAFICGIYKTIQMNLFAKQK